MNVAIGLTDFSKYAKQLMMTWTGRLKLGQGTDCKTAPEPGMEMACMYSTGKLLSGLHDYYKRLTYLNICSILPRMLGYGLWGCILPRV